VKLVSVLLLAVCTGAAAEPLTLVSTLSDRPVFNLVSDGVVQSRSLAPGNRVNLEPGTFSGLGLKSVSLAGGQIYYLARVAALPSLYVLPPDQALILNQSGQPVELTLGDTSGLVASGGFALASVSSSVTCNGAPASLEGGHVYRLLLTSPEGLGTAITLTAWK
jgi:hypothetical protein